MKLFLAQSDPKVCKQTISSRGDELKQILDLIDDGTTGITLDFIHATATGVVFSLLESYHERLRNVHISNRTHKPFESETQNLTAFLTKLQKYKYNGPLTIELNRKCSVAEILRTKTVLEQVWKKSIKDRS